MPCAITRRSVERVPVQRRRDQAAVRLAVGHTLKLRPPTDRALDQREHLGVVVADVALAEEVEHKAVAHDVWAAVDGNRFRYAAAMSVCFAMLVWFIFLGTVAQLTAWRRVLSPLAWFRLIKWGFGFAFEVMPTIAITALPGHHPSNQADPAWMVEWLATYDAETNTIPAWDAPIDSYVQVPVSA